MHDDASHSSEQIDNKREELQLKTIESVHNIAGFDLSETKQLFFSLITACHYNSLSFQYSPQKGM